jgi:hypothetical protein
MAQAALSEAVAAENERADELRTFVLGLIGLVNFNFGASPSALEDFGRQPPKARTPMTAEQKAIANAKRAATRRARGTMGAKARKAIKGNVDVKLVVTPGREPAT